MFRTVLLPRLQHVAEAKPSAESGAKQKTSFGPQASEVPNPLEPRRFSK
jgi:hypothetical protein